MNYLSRVFESSAKTLLGGESIFLSKSQTKIFKHCDCQLTGFHCYWFSDQIRGKKVKAKGAVRNAPRKTRPKHRGWKEQDGSIVSENKILATQRQLRWHPGLNVRPKTTTFDSFLSFFHRTLSTSVSNWKKCFRLVLVRTAHYSQWSLVV